MTAGARGSRADAASKIFICYRRDDSASQARSIYEGLRAHFEGQVFRDLEAVELGVDFEQQIDIAMSACAAVLVLIGRDWLNATDELGNRRLDLPDDYVRREISTALERSNVVVIPLLVDRAGMPRATDLPPPLVGLAARRGLELREERWEDDMRLVIERLRSVISSRREPRRGKRATAKEQAPPRGSSRVLRYVALGTLAIAVVAMIAAAFFTHAPPAPARANVKIGAIFKLSGTGADANAEVIAGARFAVKYINEMSDPDSTLPLKAGHGLPGLHGAKLQLAVSDAGPGRCTIEPAFDRLVDRDHVAAAIGANESTVTLRAIIEADQRRIPLVNAGSSATNLTIRGPSSNGTLSTCGKVEHDPRPSPWLFRVGPDDKQVAEQFLALLDDAERRRALGHVGKVAILQESSDIFGNGGAAAIQAAAHRRGIRAKLLKYPSVLGTSVDVSDDTCMPWERRLVDRLRRLVKQLAHDKPDVVFAVSYLPDAVTIVQAMHDLGYEPPALLASGSSFLSDAFIAGVRRGNPACGLGPAVPTGTIAQGAWAAEPQNPTATARRIARLFEQQSKGRRPMSVRSAGGFTAVMTLAKAISDAGSTDPYEIQARLRRVDLPAGATIMPWRGIQFSPGGQNTRSQIVLQQLVGGRYRVVYPDDKATDAATFP